MGRGLSAGQAKEFEPISEGDVYWAARDAFRERLFERLGGIAFVGGVTSSSQKMMARIGSAPSWCRPRPAIGRAPTEAVNVMIAPNYFQQMQDPAASRELSSALAIAPARSLSPSSARRWLGGCGRARTPSASSSMRMADRLWLTVVGVVGDTRDNGIDKPPVRKVFQPWAQNRWWPGQEMLVVRTSVDPLAVAPIVQRALTELDPARESWGFIAFADVVRDSAWRLNYATLLLTGLAGLSVLLSLIGIYGVLSHAVRDRTREIGVRMALGARPLQVVALVLRQTSTVVAISVLLGLAMSAVLAKSLQALLFRVGPLDLVAFAGAALVLLGAAAVASYVPAKRAATMNPVTALRHD